MENYVQVTLSDGRHARVNREKIVGCMAGSCFDRLLTIVGTSDRYYYLCTDETLDDPEYLAVDIVHYLKTAAHLVHDAPESKFQGRHDFSYCDILTEIFWSAPDRNNTVEIKVYHGTVDVAPYRLSYTAIEDKKTLVGSAVMAIVRAKKPAPFINKMQHDFIYRDEKIECRWNTGLMSADVSVFRGTEGPLSFTASLDEFSSQQSLELWVIERIIAWEQKVDDLTDAEFEPEDLTTQFIRACQNEFGTNGEITTITVNTKTKEITVTAQIEHKLYL